MLKSMRNIFRKGCRVLNIPKIAASTLLCIGALFFVGESKGLAKTTAITPGVSLDSTQSVILKKNQFVNTLHVNLNNPYTTIDFGTSDPLHKRNPVTTLAKLHTYDKHNVVGAVNASFFHMNNGEPAFLLAKKNRLVYLGSAAGADTSFGLTKDKTAQIADYKVDVSVTHKGKAIQVNSYNRNRANDKSIVYTSSFRHSDTQTSSAGYEVVVSGLPKKIDRDLTFGETLTGKVTAIRPYGESKKSVIPKDGFVISTSGSHMQNVKNMAIGDEVSIQLNVNKEWEDAEFILASGPLLVDNGRASTNIIHSSAAYRTSRTAVAIDRTGKKVFMVTVDSRRKGKSEGMTLREFANYLVSIGAYKAINLDGGGSTTMAARIPGNRYASLVNLPSEGSQRPVSAILEAISTAPNGEPAKITVNQSSTSNLLVGGKSSFSVASALDAYNNIVSPANFPAKYSVEGAIGRMENSTFIAEKVGTGSVLVQVGTAKARVPVTVEAQPTKLASNVSSIYTGKGKTHKVSLSATGKNGKPLLFDSKSIKWSVTGKIGTISSDGTFKSGQADGKGTIVGVLNGKKISIPVTVNSKPLAVHSLDSVKQWKAESAKAETLLLQKADSLKKGGKGYIGMQYDFTKYKSGVSASYMKPVTKLTVPHSPTSLSLWAMGDGKNHWLRGKIKDAAGKVYTIDFTKENKFDWKGQWKQVTAAIPKDVKYPIAVESIYVAEGKSTNKNKGRVYFDELMANYN